MSEIKQSNSELGKLTPDEQAEALKNAAEQKRARIELETEGLNQQETGFVGKPADQAPGLSNTSDLLALNKATGVSAKPLLGLDGTKTADAGVEELFHKKVTEGELLIGPQGEDTGAHDAVESLQNLLERLQK